MEFQDIADWIVEGGSSSFISISQFQLPDFLIGEYDDAPHVDGGSITSENLVEIDTLLDDLINKVDSVKPEPEPYEAMVIPIKYRGGSLRATLKDALKTIVL